MQFPAEPERHAAVRHAGGRPGARRTARRRVDAPLGKGHVVMFAIRPFWRWQTQGTYMLGFNAILNWNDLDAGKAAPAATRDGAVSRAGRAGWARPHPAPSTPPAPLAPARLFIRADPQRDLADDFVRQQRIRGVEAPERGDRGTARLQSSLFLNIPNPPDRSSARSATRNAASTTLCFIATIIMFVFAAVVGPEFCVRDRRDGVINLYSRGPASQDRTTSCRGGRRFSQ